MLASEKLIEAHCAMLIEAMDTLDNGAVWEKPFRLYGSHAPANGLTGAIYKGVINNITLSLAGQFAADRRGCSMDPRWLPFAEAKKRGLLLKNNAVDPSCKLAGYSRVIVFFPMTKKITVENRDYNPTDPGSKELIDIQVPTGRFGTGAVVNVVDTIAVEQGVVAPLDAYLGSVQTDNEPILELESVCQNFPHETREHMGTPHYSPSTKTIGIPPIRFATGPVEYYSTLLHEIAHQVGDMMGKLANYGKADGRSYEELVAEATASIVLGTVGFAEKMVTKNSATYLKGWLAAHSDKSVLWSALTEASERARYILRGAVPVSKIKDKESFTFL